MILIRDYRLRKGMTMKELGTALGVSESAVGLWENGRRKPNYERLLQIAEILECSVDDLLGGAPEEKPEPQQTYPEITMIARAGKKMTQEQRDLMLKWAMLTFPEAFDK